MFKLNDKKHRKRALMKLQGCKPNCGASDEKDDFYEVSNGQKVTNKTVEYSVQYDLDEAPSHLVRKTMKYEEVKGQGFDETDRAGSLQRKNQLLLDFPTIERNMQSKVVTQAPRNLSQLKLDQGLECISSVRSAHIPKNIHLLLYLATALMSLT